MSTIRMQRLDAEGRPAGSVEFATGGLITGVQPLVGDLVDKTEHYAALYDVPLKTITIDITFCEVNPAALYLITRSRRVFGWPSRLPINGHEYRRRRGNR